MHFPQSQTSVAVTSAPSVPAQNNAAASDAYLEAQQRQERQNQIDSLQSEISNLQSDMAIDLKGVDDMKAACGGGMFQAICNAKSAKYQREADADQEQIRQKQLQLQELGGASAATAGGSDSSGNGGGSYSGPNSIIVEGLLSRSPTAWSCPASKTERPTAQPIIPSSLPCMRDKYAWAALLQAWAAECHSRLGMESEAEQNAQQVMQNVNAAKSMCSSAPAVQTSGPGCSTLQLVPCP